MASAPIPLLRNVTYQLAFGKSHVMVRQNAQDQQKSAGMQQGKDSNG
jgi:hypothetical protein